MNDPILITGCARSGTSMVAGVINICGAFGGDMAGPNKNNQKGMFENTKIRNTIVKPFYKDLGVDQMGQYPLPDLNNLPIPTNWRRRVESVIMDHGYTEGAWMYKGAKMCQHWPVWDYAFPKAKWIIVRRNTADIIKSCQRTGFMRAFKNVHNQNAVHVSSEWDGWKWWVHQHLDRFREMINHGLNTHVVWPERMVDGDYSQIKDMIEWLGLEWHGEEVAAFIEPKLWHVRYKRKQHKDGNTN